MDQIHGEGAGAHLCAAVRECECSVSEHLAVVNARDWLCLRLRVHLSVCGLMASSACIPRATTQSELPSTLQLPTPPCPSDVTRRETFLDACLCATPDIKAPRSRSPPRRYSPPDTHHDLYPRPGYPGCSQGCCLAPRRLPGYRRQGAHNLAFIRGLKR